MTPLNPTPTTRLAEVSPEGADSFRKLREQMLQAGPLDNTTCELIVISEVGRLFRASLPVTSNGMLSLLSIGDDVCVPVPLRLVRANVAKAVLQHAVMAPLGATTVVYQVALALKWIDELYAET